MLRIRADVNGHPIGWIFIHNTGRTNSLGMHLYDIATYDPETKEMLLGVEGINHHRPWGWKALAATALELIDGRQ